MHPGQNPHPPPARGRPRPAQRSQRVPRSHLSHPIPPPNPTVWGRWRRLSKKMKALAIVVVAMVGGVTTLKSGAIDPLWSAYTHRQPHYDEVRVSDLRAGISFDQFSGRLHSSPVAVVRHDVPLRRLDKRVHARDELFILPTMYVEAFIDDEQTVQGYTVTARSRHAPLTIDVGGVQYDLNSETFGQVNLFVDRVAEVCGAHIAAYYEVSNTSNAQANQTIAVGAGGAGPMINPLDLTCPPAAARDLPLVPPSGTSSDDLYVIDEHIASEAYRKATAPYRSKAIINSVAITAPLIDMAPEMLSLHPSFLSNLE
jgi:hypothetical protein